MINIEMACQELKIPQGIYLKILGRAIEQTTTDLSGLMEALQANSVERLQALSHKIKGDFANLRVLPISETARQLNDLTRGGAYDPAKAESFVETLQQQFETLKENYQQF
jgi:HPt (histidine-containing phosphotransfer) domain-containing protein